MNFLANMKFKNLQKKLTKYNKQRDEGDNRAAQKEMLIHQQLGDFYHSHRFDKGLPNALFLADESYRAAALLGSRDAQYIFAERMMSRANFWHEFALSIHGENIHHQYAKQHYAEAHQFLKTAITAGHPLAKRLLGVATIRGYGLEKNIERGAQLVIESIKEENRFAEANKIFEELGLHSPEIFTALMTQAAKQKT